MMAAARSNGKRRHRATDHAQALSMAFMAAVAPESE
jgi:hypothetical protein